MFYEDLVLRSTGGVWANLEANPKPSNLNPQLKRYTLRERLAAQLKHTDAEPLPLLKVRVSNSGLGKPVASLGFFAFVNMTLRIA